MARYEVLAILLLLAGDSHSVARRANVLLVPIGSVPAVVIADLQRELPGDVIVEPAIPLPERAFNAARKQYLGSALLAELERRYRVADPDRVLGVIDADVYAPNLYFIFGQARLPGTHAVVALPRLRDSFRGRPENPQRFRERAVKVATHELGHSFGFTHCPDRACVMHFANSVFDADRQGTLFCARERPR